MKNRVVVITGVARGIGKAIAEAFEKEGAIVCGIDILNNQYYQGDISKEETLHAFADSIIQKHKKIDYLINNACLNNGGIETCSYEEFNQVLRVGISAPFLLSKLFRHHFTKDGCIVNLSSTRYLMSQADTESYSAAKGGITALTHALAVSLAGVARVNAIAPGWIDTYNSEFEEADSSQHLVKRVGNVDDIVNTVFFLCSDKSSFITGEVLTVDGGMSKQMIYHNDEGWKLEK